MAEIVLNHVSKRYRAGDPLAVRDFSLRIADGELAVIVGPSGCGKSTLLRLIAGLESPDSGDIRMAGRSVNGVSPAQRDIAMVFQDSALYPHMTGRQNLAFALRMRNMPKAEIDRRVRDTAAMLEMTDLLDRKPGSLSGGERQRLALGRTGVRAAESAAILLDEPLSQLDAGLRIAMRKEIRSLHQRLKATMIHVTHDQEEAMTLADRLIVMAEGTLQQDGSPMEVHRSPRNRLVAGFIGSPAMNFLDGVLVREDERTVFIEGDAGGARGARIELPMMDATNADRVILGVRPEHVTMRHETEGVVGCDWRARVLFVEHRGHESVVHAETDVGNAVLARTAGTELPQTGDEIQLRFDASKAHLFRPGPFGERIVPTGESN